MTNNSIWENRSKLRDSLPAYLAAENLFDKKSYCAPCPDPACGNPTALIRDGRWVCMRCGSEGDTVDYALRRYPQFDEGDAIRHIHRMLGMKITQLDSVPAGELMRMRFRSRPQLVEGLIGQGLFLLAGPSKIGKSWLVLDLALHIARGEPIWDMETTRCEVLYVSLEDTQERLQKRLRILNGEAETGPLYLATEAELMGVGFEEQISNFLAEHKGVRLVIVDTLQKIRQLSRDKNCYADDYATISALKRIADQHGITLLLVHHTRKMKSDDPMEMISGTTGLLGAADGSLILEKDSRLGNTASLTATGRDACDQQLILAFDRERCVWELKGRGQDPEEERDQEIFEAAAELVEACGGRWEGSAAELRKALECGEELTLPVLSHRFNRGRERLRKQYGLVFETGRTKERRFLRLKRAEPEQG